jgi:hypothetical protein
MKTKKEVIADHSDYKNLINAVVSRVGVDSIEDINNHGIDGGFGGFIYYDDTVKFFKTYKKDIMKLAEEMADSLGEDLLSMISNFNCLSSGDWKNRKPDFSENEIAMAIYSGKGEVVTTIQNAMALFAAEEVCRMFEE